MRRGSNAHQFLAKFQGPLRLPISGTGTRANEAGLLRIDWISKAHPPFELHTLHPIPLGRRLCLAQFIGLAADADFDTLAATTGNDGAWMTVVGIGARARPPTGAVCTQLLKPLQRAWSQFPGSLQVLILLEPPDRLAGLRAAEPVILNLVAELLQPPLRGTQALIGARAVVVPAIRIAEVAAERAAVLRAIV